MSLPPQTSLPEPQASLPNPQASQPGGQASSLRLFYGGLAVLASIAATKAMVWPLWPRAQELKPTPIAQALQQAGFAAKPLAALKPTRTAELATSAAQTFALGDGQELRLMNATVRERFNLQTAFVTRIHPELHLKTRNSDPQVTRSFTGSHQEGSPPKAKQQSGPPPKANQQSGPPPKAKQQSGHPPKASLQSGPPQKANQQKTIQPKASRQQFSRQTCLVAGPGFPGGYGATRDQLTQLTDRMAAQQSQNRWQVLLGLKSNRDYRCTLISVRSAPGQPAMAVDRWQKLLSILQAALNKPGAYG